MSNIVHTSTLELEINPIKLAPGTGVEKLDFWKISVDRQLFSNRVQPFSASDAEIERYGCTACGTPGCGTGWVSVRRAGPYILWFGTIRQTDDYRGLFPGMAKGALWVFDAKQYSPVIPTGHLEDLPEPSVDEIRELLFSGFPKPDLALYRVPYREGDPYGADTLKRVSERFSNSIDDLRISNEPEHYWELRIGLDLPGFPECVWRIGELKEGLAVLFLSQPLLPIWLCGDAVNRAFALDPI